MVDDLDDGLDYNFEPGSPDGFLVDGQEDHTRPSDEEELEARPAKKPKRNKDKQSQRRQLKMESEVERKKNLSKLDSATISDYIIGKVSSKKGNKDLSGLELQERSVEQSAIVDCSKWIGENEPTLDKMPEFFQSFKLLDLENNDIVVVLSLSATRVCDVSRALRSLDKRPVLKLMNKNNLEFDKRGLLRTKTRIASATPGRIRKLITSEVLDPTRVKKIVMDSSFLDMKTLHVWDLEETIPVVSELSKLGAKIYVY